MLTLYYATRAVLKAISGMEKQPEYVYHYANHFHHTDIYSFGSAHSVASLPPNIDSITTGSIVPYLLEIMYDLKTKLKLKKRIRKMLQLLIINRPINQDGGR